MARAESGKRAIGWAAAAALLATTPLLAACSGDSDSSSGDDAKSSASGSQSPSAPPSPSTGESNGSGAETGGRPTMAEAVSTWVGAVIEKDTKKACLVSAIPGKGSAPAQGATPEKCDPATLKKLATGLNAMSKAFTPPDASGKPTVKVNAPEPKKDKALVPSAQIMVNGK
ncbi:hypothetical protein ACFU99_26970, partial [Streptomyces sp. NPDC057654]|uniref:hypothetical protein n=1 Tax=Streptomyces sp. NPDC057654 TaxID=3346196 RepID=UPI00368F725C